MYMELCRFIYGKKNILIVDHALRNQSKPYITLPLNTLPKFKINCVVLP